MAVRSTEERGLRSAILRTDRERRLLVALVVMALGPNGLRPAAMGEALVEGEEDRGVGTSEALLALEWEEAVL